MTLDEILQNFTSYIGDAVMVSFKPDHGVPKPIHVNAAFERMFGWSAEDVLNGTAAEQANPTVAESMRKNVTDLLDRGARTVSAEVKCQRKDGSYFWASISVTAIEASRGRFSTAVIRDIDSFKKAEEDAAQALEDRARLHVETNALEERLLAAINAINHPLAIWDKDYRLVICNDAFAPRIMGSAEAIAKGTSLEDVLRRGSMSGAFVDALGREEEWLEEAVRDIRAGQINHTTHYTDGKIYNAVSHHPPNGDTLIISSDITRIEKQREKLETYSRQLEKMHLDAQDMARTDVVTGLGNRRRVQETLEDFEADRAAGGPEIAALHIDLDRFKQINDTMGHAAGDFVLKEVARRLTENVRDGDVVARAGGDEFVVLTRYRGSETDLEDLAHRLLWSLKESVVFQGKECRFGASIGIARTPIVEAGALLTHSDIALYKAKQSGRGCVRSFRSADLEALQKKKSLSDDILRGLENGEFRPVYQTQVCGQSRKVVAIEALARWHHPTHGIMAPAMFLAAASEIGVGDIVDQQIFQHAIEDCTAAFAGMEAAPILSLNVGLRRLMSDDILKAGDIASAYPGKISMELLETIFMDDPRPDFVARLGELSAMGFGIEVDDFGTGRASIIALQQIAPDFLKIDRKLIAPIVTSQSSLALVRSIIEIGRALGIGITAEGVETEAHAELLRDLGCDRLQGFHFSRPDRLENLCILPDRIGSSARSVA